jgi:hypothetical protein
LGGSQSHISAVRHLCSLRHISQARRISDNAEHPRRFISSVTSEILPNLTGQFILSYSIRSAKVETARQLALYAYQAPHRFFLEKLSELHPEAEEALKNEEAYGLVSTFSAITGVSMGRNQKTSALWDCIY